MYVVKLAVAMVLAGGVQRIDASGTKVRGMYTEQPTKGSNYFFYADREVSVYCRFCGLLGW